MALISGTYQLEKNENFLEILLKGGLSEEHAKLADGEKAKLTITVNGKKLIWKYEGLKTLESVLVDGEEVEETMAVGEPVLSTTKVEGSVVTISSKDKNGRGTMTRVYTFSQSGLVGVITLGSGSKATRYYKRV